MDHVTLQMQDVQRAAAAESQALQAKLQQQMEEREKDTSHLRAVLQASRVVETVSLCPQSDLSELV